MKTSSGLSAEPGSWPRRTWVGLLVVAGYIVLAAGLGSAASSLVSDDQAAADFALGHLVPLPIAVVLLLVVVRRSGWGQQVWRETPVVTAGPVRRRWLVAFPVLAVVLAVGQLPDIPWAQRTLAFAALIAAGTLLVGLGEELAVRGVLLTAVRGHRGELTALLVTSIVFAVAHVPGSIIAGAPVGVIAVQVVALGAVGTTYYWIRRVTGRLWPAVLIHAFTDWVLYLGSGEGSPTVGIGTGQTTAGPVPVLVTAQFLLWVGAAASIVSVAREDRRARQAAVVGSAETGPTAPAR